MPIEFICGLLIRNWNWSLYNGFKSVKQRVSRGSEKR